MVNCSSYGDLSASVQCFPTRFPILNFEPTLLLLIVNCKDYLSMAVGSYFLNFVAAFPITLSLVDANYLLLPPISPETRIESNSDSFVLDRLYLTEPCSKHTPQGRNWLIFYWGGMNGY